MQARYTPDTMSMMLASSPTSSRSGSMASGSWGASSKRTTIPHRMTAAMSMAENAASPRPKICCTPDASELQKASPFGWGACPSGINNVGDVATCESDDDDSVGVGDRDCRTYTRFFRSSSSSCSEPDENEDPEEPEDGPESSIMESE